MPCCAWTLSRATTCGPGRRIGTCQVPIFLPGSCLREGGNTCPSLVQPPLPSHMPPQEWWRVSCQGPLHPSCGACGMQPAQSPFCIAQWDLLGHGIHGLGPVGPGRVGVGAEAGLLWVLIHHSHFFLFLLASENNGHMCAWQLAHIQFIDG